MRYARWLLVVALVIVAGLATKAATAECNDGTSGSDTIDCTGAPDPAQNPDSRIDAGAGDDSIVVDDGDAEAEQWVGPGAICGDSADNNCLGGQESNLAPGDGGNDTIVINDGVGDIIGD